LYAAACSRWVLAEERIIKAYALVPEHVVKKRHHPVFDVFCCQNAIAIGVAVNTKACVWQAIQGSLVMLCLKAEIAFYHNHYFAEQKLRGRLNSFDVALY